MTTLAQEQLPQAQPSEVAKHRETSPKRVGCCRTRLVSRLSHLVDMIMSEISWASEHTKKRQYCTTKRESNNSTNKDWKSLWRNQNQRLSTSKNTSSNNKNCVSTNSNKCMTSWKTMPKGKRLLIKKSMGNCKRFGRRCMEKDWSWHPPHLILLSIWKRKCYNKSKRKLS